MKNLENFKSLELEELENVNGGYGLYDAVCDTYTAVKGSIEVSVGVAGTVGGICTADPVMAAGGVGLLSDGIQTLGEW